MPAVAGDIRTGAPPNANWRACDGTWLINTQWPDYWRRVMFKHGGAGIGGMGLPSIPGSCICIADEPHTDPPVNTDIPAVTQDADTLSCTMGNWQGEPSSYSYEWRIDGVVVPGFNDMLGLTAADVGKSATCTVTATNAIGSTAAPPSMPLVVGPIA